MKLQELLASKLSEISLKRKLTDAEKAEYVKETKDAIAELRVGLNHYLDFMRNDAKQSHDANKHSANIVKLESLLKELNGVERHAFETGEFDVRQTRMLINSLDSEADTVVNKFKHQVEPLISKKTLEAIEKVTTMLKKLVG